LFIRLPLAALLHAELRGKYGKGDVVAGTGAANARKKYNTACLLIQSVQPVCGNNCNSVRLSIQFVRCLWIQSVHRLSVDTRSTVSVCGYNLCGVCGLNQCTVFLWTQGAQCPSGDTIYAVSVDAISALSFCGHKEHNARLWISTTARTFAQKILTFRWRQVGEFLLQARCSSPGIGNYGWQYILPDGLNDTEIQFLCPYRYQVFIGRLWLNGAGGGVSAGVCLDGKPLKTKGPEHGELMRWASVVQNVVQPKHENGSYWFIQRHFIM
jgi:hypothetical protein